LTGILPLIRSEGDKEGYLCSSLDLHDSESFGCVKFDFLALGSLSVYDANQPRQFFNLREDLIDYKLIFKSSSINRQSSGKVLLPL
jgi:DNA polymerase III alpha subunit